MNILSSQIFFKFSRTDQSSFSSPSLLSFVGSSKAFNLLINLTPFTPLTDHRVHTILSKFFIQFSRTDTSSFSGRLSAVVVDVLVGCLIYWSNKDENPFNQNNREQASVEGSECDNLVTQREKIWKSNFILKHLKSIELKILWNHILK